MNPFEPALVGVSPRAAYYQRERLFSALGAVFAVRFEPRDRHERNGLDAAFVVGPSLPVSDESGLPLLAALTPEEDAVSPQATHVTLAPEALHVRRVAGAVREHARIDALPVASPDRVLASAGRAPLWIGDGEAELGREIVALAPAELRDGETLRDRLQDGRFLALLPLVAFLRGLRERRGWVAPPLRASFLIDDPNLHWPTYGFVDFAELAREAHERHFHLAFATVPLDAWFAHPRVVRLFRSHADRFSLLLHGNNHVYRELERPQTDEDAQALCRQAIERIRRLEVRTGLHVARIMAPPHGVCSEATARALLATGYEGLCVSRPYPWLDGRTDGRPAAAGWEPADVVIGGLPVLPRYRLDRPRVDLPFRALLDQPLILYGHHQDLRTGVENLTSALEQIDNLGPVDWMSPERILRSNFATWRRGSSMCVRLYSRRIDLAIPAGMEELLFEWGNPQGSRSDLVRVRTRDGEVVVPLGEAVASPQVGAAEVEICAGESETRTARSQRGVELWPVVRRVGVEARDRLQPLLAAAGRAAPHD